MNVTIMARRELESRCSREVCIPYLKLRYYDTPNDDGSITRLIIEMAPALPYVELARAAAFDLTKVER